MANRYRQYDQHVYELNAKSRKKNWLKWRDKALATRRARYAETYLIRTYGITKQQYDALLVKQGNRCPICKTDDPGKHPRKNDTVNWHVDHDHKTGQVRGLLCFRCNAGLGHMKDDPQLVMAAYEYLIASMN